MAAFNFHQRRTRRWWYTGVALVAVALMAVFFAGAASGTLGGSKTALTLAGSPYNGANGTLDTVAGIGTYPDVASGSSDNAFGQGTKEDSSDVTVVDGSIPPNKNDLTTFYEGSSVTTDGVFLYLGWLRAVNIGNANLDFEINKHATTISGSPWTGSTTGSFAINRTAGDILVTYDFGGSGAPELGVNRWLVSASDPVVEGFDTNVCYSAHSFPCWGDHKDLGNTISEGSVSSDGLFGEAVINLTDAGILSSGTCDFGRATTFLKSRSSSSFTAELKDFIAPVTTPLAPCAMLTVVKHTYNASGTRTGYTQAFSFTPSASLDSSVTTFQLTDTGTDTTSNTKTFSSLGAGSYSVTETDPSPDFALTGGSCVDTGTTTPHGTLSTSTRIASVTLALGDDVTCTFQNTQQTGAIKITKVSSKKDTSGNNLPLGGAQFTYAPVTGGVVGTATNFPSTTDASGHACVDGLPFGTYRIAESSAPTGYAKDAGTQDVTVTTTGTCASGSTQATPTSSFVDTPLSQIYLGFHSVAGNGVTSATVQCTGESSAANLAEGQATKTLGNGTSTLTPGTYTCTVVVDP